MRVVILGATGGTGIELLRRSIAAGHSVTAFVRNADALKEYSDHIHIQTGDLLNEAHLARILQYQDSVLSGFGPRVPIAKADAHLLKKFATSPAGAMQQSGVHRLVIISTAFLFKDSIIPPTYLLGGLMLPSLVKDSAGLEAIIQESQLDWTIVRPPQLTDLPFTGRYRERIGHLPGFGFKISRADVADYFVKCLSNQSLTQRIVGISN